MNCKINENNNKFITELESEFSKKIILLLEICHNKGIDFEVTEGIRDPLKQAIYWKGSRTNAEVTRSIKLLRKHNADFLAYCLFVIGDYTLGRKITDALPGLSWHQYGQAVDLVWIIDGKRCWDNINLYDGMNGYELLAEEATKISLISGHYWQSIKDSCHIQANTGNPLDIYNWEIISNKMEEKFSHLFE